MTGPFETTVFLLVWVLGLLFWGGVGYGFYLWIRKLRRELSEGAPDGSIQRQLLDELQELRIEVGIVVDRLGRIESRLDDSRELPGARDASKALPPHAPRAEEPPAGAAGARGEDPLPQPPGDARS